MKYINEINSFERWLETNYLPASSQLLWYKLIALFNRSGWAEWVVLDNQRLMGLIQEYREDTAIKIRNKLIDAGLIEYQKGKKGSPNKYKLISIESKLTFTSEVQTVAENKNTFTGGVKSVVQTVVKSGVYTEAQTADIKKEKDINKDLDKDKDKTIFVATDIATTNANFDNNKKTNKPVKSFDVDGIEYKSSKYLADEILKVNPNAKVPKTDKELFKWCIHIDYILRVDNKPVEEFRKVLAFIVKDNFWSTVILSTQKLRAKYDQIFMQMQKQYKGGNYSEANNTSESASKPSYGTVL